MSALDRLAAAQKTGSKPRSRSLLPSDPPPPGASSRELMAWLTVVFHLGGDPIAAIKRWGTRDDGRLIVYLRSGKRIVWDRQAEILDNKTLVKRVILAGFADTPSYGTNDGDQISRVVIRAADVVELTDDLAETSEWARSFLEAAHHLDEVHDMRTAAGKYAGLCALRDWRRVDAYAGMPAADRAAVLHDTDGRQYVRCAAFAAHVRGMASRPVAWDALHGRMAEVGWLGPFELEQRQPAGNAKVKLHAYVVPAGWEDA